MSPTAQLHDGDSALAMRAVATAAEVTGFGTDVSATLDWARQIAPDAPRPGTGTTGRFDLLAATASLDVGAARVLEPHLDALAILAEAGVTNERTDASWGVFAAEGPAARLEARDGPDGWTLTGTKPWCSLAGYLTNALVTAWIDDTRRRLFAVSLQDPSVSPHAGPWVSRGLSQIVSAPVDFDATHAEPVGEPGWYAERAGFWWGAVGVAAVWWGGAVPLLWALRDAARRPNADQLAAALLGEADAAMWGARTVLADAACDIDDGVAGDAARLLAERTRAVVVVAVERVLTLADHALGPAPLTTDDAHARRVADLRVYVRQHHGERDFARLGRQVAGT